MRAFSENIANTSISALKNMSVGTVFAEKFIEYRYIPNFLAQGGEFSHVRKRCLRT